MNLSDTLPLALAALAIEAALGYPQGLYARIGHPVTWLGALIAALDRSLNRERDSATRRKAAGVAALLVLLAVTLIASLLLVKLCSLLGPLALLPLALLRRACSPSAACTSMSRASPTGSKPVCRTGERPSR